MTATLSLFPDLAPAPVRRVPVKQHMRHVRGEAKPASEARATSAAALERHTDSGELQTNKRRVLAALALHDGATAAELALVAGVVCKQPGQEEVETRRRLGELAKSTAPVLAGRSTGAGPGDAGLVGRRC